MTNSNEKFTVKVGLCALILAGVTACALAVGAHAANRVPSAPELASTVHVVPDPVVVFPENTVLRLAPTVIVGKASHKVARKAAPKIEARHQTCQLEALTQQGPGDVVYCHTS